MIKNMFSKVGDKEPEKRVYSLILKSAAGAAVWVAALDYIFYSRELAYLEFIFGFVSIALLYNLHNYLISYAFSSRLFILFMSLPIYWSFLFSKSLIESTILLIFIPLLCVILRPLTEVFVCIAVFALSFVLIILSGAELVAFSPTELFKLIMTQILVTLFIAFYVRANKKYQQIISEQSEALKEVNEQLENLVQEKERQASIDTLTGLKNRIVLTNQLEYLFAQFKRKRELFSLIIFDIDNFKRINDTYGHVKGDEVLQKVAKVSLESFRDMDSVIRYGGEEFVVLLPHTNIEHAIAAAERTRESIEKSVIVDGNSITASFGVVEVDDDMRIQDLISLADLALYRAKESGKNRVEKAI